MTTIDIDALDDERPTTRRTVPSDYLPDANANAAAAAAATTEDASLVLRSLRSLQTSATATVAEEYSLHHNSAAEKHADDAKGYQGGQLWSDPTGSPTASPTAPAPTSSPTGRPTLAGREFILRGVTWYDRNANGARDSDVDVASMGLDVEYKMGVGGVTVQLVRCDPDTGRAYVPQAGETQTQNNYASTMTTGYDSRMKPQIVSTEEGENGKFNIRVNGLEMYYFVQVKAPDGFLLTSGICDPNLDDNPLLPFHCHYGRSVEKPALRHRRLQEVATTATVTEYGIPEGRSNRCIYVDKEGQVQDSLDFGVMRVGDAQEVGTKVNLVLEFEGDGANAESAQVTSGRDRRRRLKDMMRRATVLDTVQDARGEVVTTRYLLADEDKQAIGTVTAEVLAGTLDIRLAEHGVELNSVDPKEVVLSSSGKAHGTAEESSSQLAVAMEIRGHYSPPPHIDFDYVVQDSINRDTSAIRRGLRDYNSNCREQSAKVNDLGVSEDAFDAVVSTSGARGKGGSRTDVAAVAGGGSVFSTACSSDILVPDYFETSLKEIKAVDELGLGGLVGRPVVYVEGNKAGGLDPWAMGPVAGIAGLIVLLAGAFVFRRAIGPRKVDPGYTDGRKTKEVDGDETRRFGEMGGDMDDGSVDSAFYSEDDEEDFEDGDETEKERKARRKRKEKMDELKANSRSARTRKKNASAVMSTLTSAALSAEAKGGGRMGRKGSEKKLAASKTSSEHTTESMERHSSSSSDDAAAALVGGSEKSGKSSREGKKRAKEHRRSSEKSSSSSHSKRGRNRRGGGDNARAQEKSDIV